jgi:hypothetical protein
MRISSPLANIAVLLGLVAAHGLLQAEAQYPVNLGDWEFCTYSFQCKNSCCSSEYSNDGKSKCTPGGSPSLCTGIKDRYKNDWEFCTGNWQCKNYCCSKQYSGDGKLKCTPGGSPDQCVATSSGRMLRDN